MIKMHESTTSGKIFSYKRIPRSRIATFDIFSIGLLKHHVSALLEFDVTESRKKLQELRRSGINISFNAWLIKVISIVLMQHKEAAAYLYSKRKLIIFNDINISILVEKKIDGKKVPIPLLIVKTNEKSAIEIHSEIVSAKNQELSYRDIVFNKKSTRSEIIYYSLPGYLRRTVWRIMLKNPKFTYRKMGNVVVTSVGMMGKVNGWFIHKSIHPISFGIGSIIKKPVIIDNQIKIREVLNMTILCDHDVIDGAPMVKLLNDFTKYIEGAEQINSTIA
jgi:pyruvate/2-oxoglutarate dehydrogenase complex dihydrolipoamide acyltransferase (E2) component